MKFRHAKAVCAVCALMLVVTGCQSRQYAPISTADYVDLQRFMGDWYVIAHIPTFIEAGAYQAVESYTLGADGQIDTRFTFLDGSFDGQQKTYFPTGFVVDGTRNAVWKMQFVWPFKADYRVVYVDAEYRYTIIGREARDFVWIMARTPLVDATDYADLLSRVAAEGYDLSQLRQVPQRPQTVADAPAMRAL